ncbi:EAL domain-containing protein [Escherichia coli]|uniref:EAL domain-containing protein n=1 Tax=Escherichia TaxID=561 RepID=UPI000B7CCA0F|nr:MULTISPECIES: EAL domain-containing protein [Escherichia]EEN2824325.1 EAL domain-containing protein [Salmonella enterica]EEY4480852.1 EAL domain-containing protein [Escherichia coli O8]EEZ5738117.1 EAL domain-containing protein [Escherichia coli O6]EFE0993285.1 EAL domain-containing protein [Escherichia coli O159:H19]EFO3069350.1 EAL domain-containing protein [Escherichia coli O73]ELP2955924.1 EAL domain-containing protein [Escherichia coli O168]ELW2703077.1 EAL domain-containing protein 
MINDEENRSLTVCPCDLTPVYYIISPCQFAANAFSVMLTNFGKKNVILMPSVKMVELSCDVANNIKSGDRLIVFIPGESLQAILTINYLSSLTSALKHPARIIFFSRLSPTWLYVTLKKNISNKKWLNRARIAMPNSILIKDGKSFKINTDFFPRFSIVSPSPFFKEGLNSRELVVLLKSFMGVKTKILARQYCLSIKTIYSQKLSGLKKLSSQFPDTATLLPDKHRDLIRNENKYISELKQFVLLEALLKNELFSVFQPVVMSDGQVAGFEILIRWHKNGQVMLPSMFFQEIHSREEWVMLTEFVIHEAINAINKFNGKFWFTVNIPATLAESSSLQEIFNVAIVKLKNPKWVGCLVAEFSEYTEVRAGGNVEKNIITLNSQGINVYLDDCFSESNCEFIESGVSFNGYKLDMSLVRNALFDFKAISKIKKTIAFCVSNESICIAEGVESEELYKKLSAEGVSLFQGYFFSEPVKITELNKTITKINSMNLSPALS